MTGSLLLSWPVGLFFDGRTRSFKFHCLLALWFPSPLRVSLFNPRGWRWPRSTMRRFRWGRRKFGLSRLPSFSPSWLTFQQFLKATLGFPLNTHIFRHVLGWWELIKNFIVVGGQGEVHKNLFLLFYFLFLLYLENKGPVSWERNALWDYEPLVSNTDPMEPRIPGPYHARRNLECMWYGIISEDEVRRP